MSQSQITREGHRFQIFSAPRYSNFHWFWLNGAAQAMAQGIQFLILGLLVLDITDSSSQLGLRLHNVGICRDTKLVYHSTVPPFAMQSA